MPEKGDVHLKNGSIESAVVVDAAFMTLKHLSDSVEGITALYDLVELCRNGTPPTDSGAEFLIKRGLLEKTTKGTVFVHSSIKNIVLSAVEGEGLYMNVVDPVSDT